MTYRKINILRKWVIRSGLQQSKLSVVRIVVLGSLMRDPSCPLRTSVILSTLILRGGWVGAANTKKNITSAGTATPTTLRLRLHFMGAHAASVMHKWRHYEHQGRLEEGKVSFRARSGFDGLLLDRNG